MMSISRDCSEGSDGRPGVILGSPCSLFSESTGLEFHTCIISVGILIFHVPLQRVTAWGSWVYIVLELKLWIMFFWWVLSFAVSPGTWPGGAWVPGGPCPGLLFAVAVPPWSKYSFSNLAPGCLTFHSAKRAPPQFENYVQIFHFTSTDDEPTGPGYMNQLAWEQKKEPVRHVRLLASRDIQPKTKEEGWFEIRRSGDTAESTLCGMQIHYGDQRTDQFPTDEWKLIERFAQEGLLKCSSRKCGVPDYSG